MSADAMPSLSAETERALAAAGLSAREREAVRDVLADMSAEESARCLGVSPSTVASYRRRACEKLGLNGVRELREHLAPAAPSAPSAPVVPADAVDVLRALGLGETEARVLALVASGRSTAQVAEELAVAPGTVSAARAHGYRFLGVHSREELVASLSPEGMERLRERVEASRDGARGSGSPWPLRAYVGGCALLLAAGVAYEIAYQLVLGARVGMYFEAVWIWLLAVVARPLAALGASQLVGFALGWRMRRRAWPWRRAVIGCAVIAAAYALFVSHVVHVLPPAPYVLAGNLIASGAPVLLALVMGLVLGVSVAVALQGRGRFRR